MCFSLFASAEADLRCRNLRSELSLLGNQPTTKLRSEGGLERGLAAAAKKKQAITHSVSVSLQADEATPQPGSCRVDAPQTGQQTKVGLPEAEQLFARIPPNRSPFTREVS